MAKNKV